MRFIHSLKKFFVLAVAAASISIISISNASATSNWEYYLSLIADNTYKILDKVNNLPVMLLALTQSSLSIMKQDNDDSSITYETQGLFAALGMSFTTENTVQGSLQRRIMADLLGVPMQEFTHPARNPRILFTLPNVNDLAFSTLLNMPPATTGAKTPYNFIKNVSGFQFNHPIPEKTWQGTDEAREKYKKYFETITSIQSYNSFILSGLLTDAAAGSSKIQNDLINKASSSTWIAQIATEEIGKVLRQILLFQSQSYVLNSQIQKTQQRLVTAQAIGNSLQIIFNQPFEQQLLSDAQGTSPTA